ncbi:GTP cyclohydrolase I FolE [Clostridium sp. SM-530-WT-3G]|uniref:GTP cyclohydrolase I FolE n=1 Tax=Clostridium sp. SM-530-WT-3G TaxID=2725303 RepID=UPI00197E837F|nr:GTP cyclohydrolase I FolE [Clostridium sp. SM-530-WT-3G]
MEELKKKIDTETIQRCIREILVALGDDPEREGLKDTPKRVAKMYEEVFEGMNYTNREIADMFNTTFEDEDSFTKDNKNLVVVRDIEIHSYCEHHMALMYNMKVNVVYRPNKKIIGLSKIARIADMVGKRLQLQERIGSDIAEILSIVTESEDIGVVISGEHSCMTARGIKKTGTKTYTTTFTGIFKEDNALRQEAILLINN